MNRKKKAIEQRDMVTAKAELIKNIAICDSKIDSLEKQIATILKEIPGLMKKKRKTRAMTEYKRANGLKIATEILEKQRAAMMAQEDQMGMAYTQQSIFVGWREFIKSSGKVLSEKSIKDMDAMMEKLGETNEGLQDFGTNMDMLATAASATSVEDEMALMKEFEEKYMNQDDDVGDLPRIPSSKPTRLMNMPEVHSEPIREMEDEEGGMEEEEERNKDEEIVAIPI